MINSTHGRLFHALQSCTGLKQVIKFLLAACYTTVICQRVADDSCCFLIKLGGLTLVQLLLCRRPCPRLRSTSTPKARREALLLISGFQLSRYGREANPLRADSNALRASSAGGYPVLFEQQNCPCCLSRLKTKCAPKGSLLAEPHYGRLGPRLLSVDL